MNPGELDQIIQIESEVSASDGMGGTVRSWVSDGQQIAAKVRPMSGRERENADQVEASSMYVVFLRNRSITEKQRIRWVSFGNRILNIRFVALTPRSHFLRVEAELGVET